MLRRKKPNNLCCRQGSPLDNVALQLASASSQGDLCEYCCPSTRNQTPTPKTRKICSHLNVKRPIHRLAASAVTPIPLTTSPPLPLAPRTNISVPYRPHLLRMRPLCVPKRPHRQISRRQVPLFLNLVPLSHFIEGMGELKA